METKAVVKVSTVGRAVCWSIDDDLDQLTPLVPEHFTDLQPQPDIFPSVTTKVERLRRPESVEIDPAVWDAA